MHSLILLPGLFTSSAEALLPAVTATLNDVLLVLMIIELAYTVMLSLRGTMLAIEPFLIVGVIATVRRIFGYYDWRRQCTVVPRKRIVCVNVRFTCLCGLDLRLAPSIPGASQIRTPGREPARRK
ncbi:MAG: phosphate-starvation-inducible PsiE family protein [Candidatus Eremiobacteraeota bacterium]|nr:phosphate-starvation-inducible PsiE family protein [Candidatus Eremiobacteraeota bacterium]